jgi:nucleotide-binding universal stress UspA family protein
MLQKNEKTMKILWAVDAFDDLKETEDKIILTLRKLAEQAPIEVYPVYVLSPDQLNLTLEFSVPAEERYLLGAKKALTNRLKDVVIPGLKPSEVIVQPSLSLKKTVESISKHASRLGCQFIVVGSHGRKGFQRLILGSFAETLFLTSQVPVMIIGSRSEKAINHNKNKTLQILLPNDLSTPSSPVFDEIFGFAKHFKAHTTLLYATPRLIEPVIQSGVYMLSGGWIPTDRYYAEDKTLRQQPAKALELLAKQFEVPFRWVADSDCSSVTQAILKYIDENPVDLIAMAAESGPIASALIGSITRQIVMEAPCPVLVLKTQGSEQK